MEQIPQFKTPEDEFVHLSKKIKERSASLTETGNDKKETVRTVLKEHIKQASQSSVMPTEKLLEGLDEHEEKIEELVHIAMSRGIVEAVRVARALKDPHLLDEFHDALVDRFYEKLTTGKYIKKESR